MQGLRRKGTAHRAQGSLAKGIGTHWCSSESRGKRSRGWHKGVRRSRTALVRVYCEFLKHCVPWQWDCCGSGGKSPSVGAEVVGAKVELSRTQPPPAAAPHSLPRPCACGAKGSAGDCCLPRREAAATADREEARQEATREEVWLQQVHNASPTRTECPSPCPSPCPAGEKAAGMTGPWCSRAAARMGCARCRW